MINRIPLGRLQTLTVLAVLGSTVFLTLGLLTISAIHIKWPVADIVMPYLYWLSIGYWVGFSLYVARSKFRSWGIAALCGLGMLFWGAVGPAILGQFPDLVMFILSDFDWIERWAANDEGDRASLVVASAIGMLPLFTVISLIWGLFPMLLASWPRRRNFAQPALA